MMEIFGKIRKPADDHDDEDIDNDAQIHGVIDGIARNLQRTAQRREEHTESEDAGEQPFLVDAERRHHVAVLRRGAHQHAPSRAVKQQPQNAEHRRPEDHQQHVVSGNCLPEKIEGATQPRRAPPEQIVRPPDQYREILDHQRQAEGRQQLEEFRRSIDAAQQQHLDQNANGGNDHRRENDTGPEPERAGQPLRQGKGDIGPEHIECAMREIHDAGDAEDDRQSGRDEKQRGRAGKSGQKLGDIKAHRACPAG